MSHENENPGKLLENHRRRLEKLKERQALQGIETPSHILIEIEDTEAKIRELQADLEASRRGETPTSPDILSRLESIEAKINELQRRLEGLTTESGGTQTDFARAGNPRSQASPPPPDFLPRIIAAPGIALNPQERTLIQHLFGQGFSQVLVQKDFGGGYGGARVLLSLPSTAGIPGHPKVTKLGRALELRPEQANYELVRNFLPFYVAPPIVGYYEQDDRAALNYQWVGGTALGQVVDLEEYYRTHPVAQIVTTLTDLLDRELGEHWYRNANHEQYFWAAEYGPQMVEHLRLILHPASSDEVWRANQPPDQIAAYRPLDLETIRQEQEAIPPDTLVSINGMVVTRLKAGSVKLQDPGSEGVVIGVELDGVTSELQVGDKVGVRGRVVYNRRIRMEQIVRQVFLGLNVEEEFIELPGVTGTYPNPLQLYLQVLGQTVEGKSYVHGDLHLRNVLVDAAGKGWLIDFAKVEERHNLFDFIKLETYIRLMELADTDFTFSLNDYVRFEEALNNATLDQNGAPPADPHLKKAYDVILAIRRIARNYMKPHPDFRNEYFPALFLYCLAVMKYYKNDGVQAARLVFATACVLGKEKWIIQEGCLDKIRKLWRRIAPIGVGVVLMVIFIIVILLYGLQFSNIPPPEDLSVTPTSAVSPIATVQVEIDGRSINVDEVQSVTCTTPQTTPHTIEITLLDANETPLPPNIFTYSWSFAPPDSHNDEREASGNFAIPYQAPCALDYQTVSIEIHQDKETLTKNIRFNITE